MTSHRNNHFRSSRSSVVVSQPDQKAVLTSDLGKGVRDLSLQDRVELECYREDKEAKFKKQKEIVVLRDRVAELEAREAAKDEEIMALRDCIAGLKAEKLEAQEETAKVVEEYRVLRQKYLRLDKPFGVRNVEHEVFYEQISELEQQIKLLRR